MGFFSDLFKTKKNDCSWKGTLVQLRSLLIDYLNGQGQINIQEIFTLAQSFKNSQNEVSELSLCIEANVAIRRIRDRNFKGLVNSFSNLLLGNNYPTNEQVDELFAGSSLVSIYSLIIFELGMHHLSRACSIGTSELLSVLPFCCEADLTFLFNACSAASHSIMHDQHVDDESIARAAHVYQMMGLFLVVLDHPLIRDARDLLFLLDLYEWLEDEGRHSESQFLFDYIYEAKREFVLNRFPRNNKHLQVKLQSERVPQ